MRYLYAIIFLFIFASNADAQKIRFCDTSNKWTILAYILGGFPNPSTSVSTINGDSVINGHEYYRLNSNYLSHGYIREDTTIGLVYMKIMFNNSIDTGEQVLYNYNLQIGDTTTNYNQFGDTYVYVVTEVDSVIIQNTWHKTWFLQSISGPGQYSYRIIEGIGSLNDPTFPTYPHNFEAFFKLKCFETNGSNPLVSPMVNNYFDNSTSCTASVDNIEEGKMTVSIAPNPITSGSKIVISSNVKSGQLTIFNSIGQKVIDVSVQNTSEYKIGEQIKVQGLYYFILTDLSENNAYTGKFVY